MKNFSAIRDLAVLLPLAALLLAGCSKQEEVEELVPEVSFSFDYPALPLSMDSAVVAGPGLELELDSNALGQAVAANHYVPSQLTKLALTKMRLHFAMPANSFYNPVKSVKVFMQANETSAVQVAKLNPVPDGAQTLLLDLNDVDVLQLVRSNQARLILRVGFDGPMPETTGHVMALGARATVRL
ncbi:MAG: hypothetical protein J5I62_08745 [Flavobacteriales bacterium]|nr:hypothetical protein [Flavobacteriales bacterium]MEB2340706.1 hypothetical protein [Flavobacteriia bacterium]